jgi:polyhydroxyalkanoate synthase subunit PhaC
MVEQSEKLIRNFEQMAAMWPEIVKALAESYETHKPAEERIVQHIAGAFADYYQRLLDNPETLTRLQLEWWQKSMDLWQDQWQQFMQTTQQPRKKEAAPDRRFKAAPWQENWYFDTLKQQYLMTADWLERAVKESTADMDAQNAKLVRFYTRQWIDALSPSNYLLTNPEALQATLETHGDNLVKGMRNFLRDLRAGRIRMTPENAFEFGKNIACTPGKVVFQNDLMQLIQYQPATKAVKEIPLLVIPAWINKYYILDLQPENSLVRWLVEQGFTVFVISWVNPTDKHRDKGFDDYLMQGPLAAMDAIFKATGAMQVNIAGYCLGGTLLAVLLAWLKAHDRQDEVACATFLTTLVDFEEAGDLGVFIDDTQLEALEDKMKNRGYLEGRDMALTFNLLRPKDLIWSFFINNYLLGKDPFPFDLLYWNADATRMPAKMHSFYLRQMYRYNNLSKPGALVIGGVPIDLRSIETPVYLLATREDHIAPWTSMYKATQIYAGPKRFVLAASGHVAGVISPAGRSKYGHWVNNKLPKNPAKWLEDAKEVAGSWWPDWVKWAEKYSGEEVKPRIPGKGKLKAIEDAPGSYVRVSAIKEEA